MEKKKDEYYLFKTIKHKSATINIYRPILTEEERKKREKEIMEGIARVFRNMDARKAQEVLEAFEALEAQATLEDK